MLNHISDDTAVAWSVFVVTSVLGVRVSKKYSPPLFRPTTISSLFHTVHAEVTGMFAAMVTSWVMKVGEV